MSIATELALLANTKENLRVSLGLSKDVPFSKYVLSIPSTPRHLFINGEQGAWYDPSDLSTLFQDAAGVIPVTADGDPVGLMLDKSGNGNHVIQTGSTARPVYRTDGGLHWLQFDGVDDVLETADALPSGLGNALFLGARLGLGDNHNFVAIFGWNVLSGVSIVNSASIAIRPSRVDDGAAKARVGAGTIFRTKFQRSEFDKTLGAVWYASWDESPTVTSAEVNLSGVISSLSEDTYAGITGKIGISGNMQPLDFFGGVVLENAPSSEARILTSKYLAKNVGVSL